MKHNREFLVSGLVAILAGALAHSLWGNVSRTTDVLVSAVALPAFAKIEAQNLKIVKLPASGVHPDAYRRLQDVAGKRTVGPMVIGQQILPGHVSEPWVGPARNNGGDLNLFFLPLSPQRWPSSVVKAGDFIDVIFSSSEQRTGITASRIILSSLPVAGVTGSGTRRSDYSGESSGLNLLVEPWQAEALAFCLENGSLHVVLSGKGTQRETPGATIQSVFGGLARSKSSVEK